jgi:hypothetical protein
MIYPVRGRIVQNVTQLRDRVRGARFASGVLRAIVSRKWNRRAGRSNLALLENMIYIENYNEVLFLSTIIVFTDR